MNAADPSRITGRQWLIVVTVQSVTLLFGVTLTSVTVILPQMKGALSATQDQISWVLTLNLVATAVATPLTGWLAGKMGQRNLLLASVLGFTGASVLCGFADSLETLIAIRVLQGAFGAPIFPLGQAILLGSFNREQQPFVVMMWGVGGVFGPILGPTFGGIVGEWLDWRWTFFLILPLGLAACIPILLAIGHRERGTARHFDAAGFVMIAVAIGATQLFFDRGQRNDWFDSLEIVVAAALAVAGFYLFMVHSWLARAPLFAPAAFTDRNFVLGLFFAVAMGMLQFTPMILFPPLLQELRGYPEAVVGYLIATRGVGNLLSFLVVAQFTRRAPRLCLATGMVIQACAGVWMGSLDVNLRSEDVFWSNLLHGFGFGLSYTPLAILTFSTLPPAYLTQGNAVFSLLRMLGSSIFISLTLLLFVHTAAEARVALTSVVSVFDFGLGAPWLAPFADAGGSADVGRLDRALFRQSSMIGYLNTFHLLTLAPIVAAPFAFMFTARRAGAIAASKQS